MKKVFLTLLCITMAVIAYAAEVTMTADDSKITYVGRVLLENQTAQFDWTGTYAKVAFEGKQIKIRLSSDATKTIQAGFVGTIEDKRDYINVFVDGDISPTPTYTFRIPSDNKDTSIVITLKKRGKHSLILHKKTEAEHGTITLKDFTTDGTFLQADSLKSRQIEFVGDSYTCGFGATLNCVKTDRFTPETEDQSLTYAAIIARYFDADFVTIAHSGMGIARNYGSTHKNYCMPRRYTQTFDIDTSYLWEASKSAFKPAITVIYIGGNDFSQLMQPHYTVFRNAYFKLLDEIKANYGDTYPILCCVPPGKEKFLGEYVYDLVKEYNLLNPDKGNVVCVDLDKNVYNSESDLGAASHPNYNGHKKVAYTMIPYIATATGWDLQEKAIK